MPQMNNRETTLLDHRIGMRIRHARLRRDLTREGLAHHIGVSPTQLRKYEEGRNRVPAARLYLVAITTGAPVAFFFDTHAPMISRAFLRTSSPGAAPRLSPMTH